MHREKVNIMDLKQLMSGTVAYLFQCVNPGLDVIKIFMHNPAEHEFFPAHK